MQLGVLGPLQVQRGDHEPVSLGGPRPRAVLAALALRAGRPVSVDRLIDEVWGSDLPAAPNRTLTTVVSRLRTALGDPDAVVSDGAGYRLDLDPDAVDAHRFERLVEQGHRALADGDPATATRLLREGLDLWRGEPLADLADIPLCDWVRPRLDELRLQALAARIEADLLLGDCEQLAWELVGLRSEHPLNEALAALQMRVLVATGRRSDALAVYKQTRDRLADDLGIDPGEELARLHLAILRDEPLNEGTARTPRRTSPEPARSPESAPAAQVPLALLAPATAGYVGRDEVLQRIRHAWRSVRAGDGAQGVLLVGEPGVGKTRTAAELTREVHEAGGLVLVGHCDEELSTPYQPFVEALDWQTAHAPELPLGRLASELARLVPELSDRRPDLGPPVDSEPQIEQHRLFEAVTAWLASVSSPNGLLLVIDDLHWGSPPTLQLLQHVLRGLTRSPDARVLLLTTHRDTDVDEHHPLASTLAELRRSAQAEQLPLHGLTPDETRRLITQVAGAGDGDDELLPLIHDPTRGNPYFATELLAHLTDVGAVRLEQGQWRVARSRDVDVPAGVREVVARRLARLTEATNELLQLASLTVGDLQVPVLQELMGTSLEAVLDAVDEALTARLVESRTAAGIRFTHGLVRTAIAERLSPTRRRHLHGRIADAIEAIEPTRVSELAHHTALAAPLDGRWLRAATHAVAAGEEALARRATDDAGHWFGQALELLGHATDTDEHLALRARCGLGEVQRDRGDPAHRETLLDVSRHALDTGHLDLAARAAIATSRLMLSLVGAVDTERIAVFEQLLALGDQLPEADWVRLSALLAAELTFDPSQVSRRLELADRTVTRAAELADPALEAWVRCITTHTVMVPDRIGELPVDLQRTVLIADRTRDPLLRTMSRFYAAMTLMGVGDYDEARSRAHEAVDLAREECNPIAQWMTSALAVQFLLYDGELEAGRIRNAECLERGMDLDQPDAAAWWGGVESLLGALDGTMGTLAEPLGDFADQHPDMPIWRAGQALALTHRGRDEQARSLLAQHELLHPEAFPEDWLQLSSFATLARLAAELDLADLGEALHTALDPYRGCWAHTTVMTLMPCELALAMAAIAAGWHDRAVTDARQGRELLAARELYSHLPFAALYLARALLGRGGSDDLVEARQVAADGVAEARRMGMDLLVPRLEEVGRAAS